MTTTRRQETRALFSRPIQTNLRVINKMANKWIAHIKKTMRTMKSRGTYKKGLGLKQVIKEAKKSWHHAKKGGADEEEEKPVVPVGEGTDAMATDAMAAGRKRRRGSKTVRKGRK
jgi:hypothetical protein